ncbi:MAG TPA: DNA primase large subunit PriL [Candidatus Thermoplasmatota archaeon]|nr:DNA primase large subunit PriL [Candidatus Thermoplasmatota archaeon]
MGTWESKVDVQLLARYPYLPVAREYVKGQGYQLGDLLGDAAFVRVRRRAVERVKGSMARDGILDVPAATEAEAEIELLSYPVARLLLAELHDPYLASRYAVAESKLLNQRLSAEGDDRVVWAVSTALGIPLEDSAHEEEFARLHFLDYLRFAPARDPSWKLVNQRLAGGFVSLDRARVVRLTEQALKDRLEDEVAELERPGREVAKAFPKELPELTTILAAHRARFAQDTSGEVRMEAFPPCMKAIWGGIQGHVNIPHMGRFAIVTFLHKLGMDSEAVLKFFSQVPDFDVNKSRYQIEHITGKIGGGTEYSTPGCSTMQTYGICPLEQRDHICFTIKHPLSYYRKKVRNLPPSKPTPPAAPAVPEAANAG